MSESGVGGQPGGLLVEFVCGGWMGRWVVRWVGGELGEMVEWVSEQASGCVSKATSEQATAGWRINMNIHSH